MDWTLLDYIIIHTVSKASLGCFGKRALHDARKDSRSLQGLVELTVVANLGVPVDFDQKLPVSAWKSSRR
jgi:hypothetical protein